LATSSFPARSGVEEAREGERPVPAAGPTRPGKAEAPRAESGRPAGGPRTITLGCRLNAFEAEVMRRHAAEAGLADAVIVNTCAVTGEAVRQAAQAIRKLRRENPEARVIVTGCAAQIDPARFAAMPEVDQVVGNAEKMRPDTFRALAAQESPRVVVGDV